MSEQEEEQRFIFQIIIDEFGDPNISSNMPIEVAIASLELVKQKLFAQYYGTVGQLRAQHAATKPDLTIARVVPPNLKGS